MPKDILGKDIISGDVIVYPGRRGSALWLTSGKVLSSEEGRITIENATGKTVKLSHLDRIAVVERG